MTSSTLIVLLFALALVWYMWNRIRPTLQHLDDADLDDFLANRLGERKLKHVREHLLSCEACKEKLDNETRKAHKMKPERLLKRRF